MCGNLKEMCSVTAYEGDQAVLTYEVGALQNPRIEWRKLFDEDKGNISRSRVTHEEGMASLIIEGCRFEDEGVYSCVVKSEDGLLSSVSCPIFLSVISQL